MRLLRSWPAVVPASGRSYVVDTLPKLILADHDYAPLADVDDDVVLLEWDIAVGREDLRSFIAEAVRDPGRVLVAPYRLYAVPGGSLERKWSHRLNAAGGFWVHMRYLDGVLLEPVSTGDPHCHTFGFGMVYLPRKLILGYLDVARRYERLRKLSDTSFSLWHYHNVTPEVPIMWDVRPVHLHYERGPLP